MLWNSTSSGDSVAVGPREVGLALYGPYILAVELGSLLLLPGIIGAYHLGRREWKDR
jgi:NADH-quinone oxidoreductase subunit J